MITIRMYNESDAESVGRLYLAMGYKRTTGIRHGWSFEGLGLKYQPMKKTVAHYGDDSLE